MKIKYSIFAVIAVGIVSVVYLDKSESVALTGIDWTTPTTDAGWAEDVKAEQLNMRLDYQLSEMKDNLDKKTPIRKKTYDFLIECPQCFKYPLLKEGKSQNEIDELYIEELNQAQDEYEKLDRSLRRIDKEIDLRKRGVVDRKQDILKLNPSTDREREELKKLK